MDAIARLRVGEAVDPRAVVALVPQAVELALDARVVRHLLVERAGEAAGAAVAERAERLIGERDPLRRVALAADLVLVLERGHRGGDGGRGAQRGEPLTAERRELVPDEVELGVQRRARLL